MSKESMLYVSPFQPMKSGISDYSERLINILKEKFDITLYVDNYEIAPNLAKDFKILTYNVDYVRYDEYDYIIYNIGNSGVYHKYIYETCLKHPGYVILHDFVIFDLFYGLYYKKDLFYSKLYENAPIKDFLIVKSMVKNGCFDFSKIANVPLNGEILKSGNKIIVHSWYSYNKILETGYIKEENVFKFTMMTGNSDRNENTQECSKEITKKNLYKKFKIPKDALVVASFGHIVPTKLNDVVCKVVKNLSKKLDKTLCFVLVGEGGAVDSYLEDNLIIKTGYTSMEDFEAFIECSDVIVNLRYPSMGETSAAMIRILQKGKPCIINPDAWFAEIPKDCVYRVNRENLYNDLERAIVELLNNPDLRKKIGANAKEYIEKEYNDKKIFDDFCKILSS